MFLSSQIPSEFIYIVELSDNYIILSDIKTLRNGVNYEVYIQFFNNSENIIHLTDYRIKQGDSYSYEVNYINNQYFNYIDSIDENFSITCSTLDTISDSFFDRPDYYNISMFVFFFMWFIIIAFNLASNLFKKGGVFFGQ